MASADDNILLGFNLEFPIYNENGTAFHGLVMRKCAYNSRVMGLDDIISGDVMYIDNTLPVTMREYIMFNGVKFVLVNPPTIVREGLVADNSELKGMTKYSFEFYHPMYELSNIPFSDVATSEDEKQYKSHDTTFFWVGYLRDFINKISKNLQSSHWDIVLNEATITDEDEILSEVKQFDNEFISDALKWGYETYHVPYTIETITESDAAYVQGKRFRIVFGKPANEIYKEGESEPFVFRFGNGIGLKNNSATPRNNKIVTRIAPYGSEDNIPYGYPQIVWTGDQNAQCTIGDSVGVKYNVTINGRTFAKAMSYPIYEGIVGGRYVKLIKHPFTRAHLMPAVFVDTLNRKVNPYADDYNPETELVAYYDADNTFPHPLNPLAPSYEAHEFEDIKPEMGAASILGAMPYGGAPLDAISLQDFLAMINGYINDTSINEAVRSAMMTIRDYVAEKLSNGDEGEMSGSNYVADEVLYEFSFVVKKNYASGYFISKDVNFTCNVASPTAVPPEEIQWDDSMDGDGNYNQSYFQITLPQLSFDLYACAAITQEMNVVMRSGACIGCTFQIQCDWEKYKASFYDENGGFAPYGAQRDYAAFPNSANGSITVLVQKDTNTFGTLKPNIYERPAIGDQFVITGISLPEEYITNAQQRLAEKGVEYMRDNNVYYYEYPVKVSESFMRNNTDILSQIANNKVFRFEFASDVLPLFIKEISIKFLEGVLPQYDITLTDEIEITLNQLGQAVEDIGILGNQLKELHTEVNSSSVQDKLSRMHADTARGRITFMDGIAFRNGYISGVGDASLNSVRVNDVSSRDFATGFDGAGWRAWLRDGLSRLEVDELLVRKAMTVYELLIHKIRATGGAVMVSAADGKVKGASAAQGGQWDVELENVDGVGFQIGDWVRCQRWDALHNTMKSYWLQVSGSYGGDHIILAGDFTKGVPEVGDELVLMGSSNPLRQGAVMISAEEGGVPVVDVLGGITGPSLTGCLRARLGGLDGITDSYFPATNQPHGYGLWSDNAWLRGTFVLSTGEDVGTLFQILDGRVESTIKGYVDSGAVQNPTFDGWEHWNAPTAVITTLKAGTDLLIAGDTLVEQGISDGGARLVDGGVYLHDNYQLYQDLRGAESGLSYAVEVTYKGTLIVALGSSDVQLPQSAEYQTRVEEMPYSGGDVMLFLTAGGGEAWVRSVRLLYKSESLIEQSAASIKLGLADTGVDIERGVITLDSDKVKVRGELETQRLRTKAVGGGAHIEIEGSAMKVFGGGEHPNWVWEVDDKGFPRLKCYLNGQFLYDLGPEGISAIETIAESWESVSYREYTTSSHAVGGTAIDGHKYNAPRANGVITTNADKDGKWFADENFNNAISGVIYVLYAYMNNRSVYSRIAAEDYTETDGAFDKAASFAKFRARTGCAVQYGDGVYLGDDWYFYTDEDMEVGSSVAIRRQGYYTFTAGARSYNEDWWVQ